MNLVANPDSFMKDEIMKLRYFSIKQFDMIPMTIEHLKMIKKEYKSYHSKI